jgi:hypothetical protein
MMIPMTGYGLLYVYICWGNLRLGTDLAKWSRVCDSSLPWNGTGGSF